MDLERVTPCFPGAALTSYDGDTFAGGVKVKLGPISMQYTGTGRFVERDEVGHRAVIEAKGKDKRGNGTAAATVTAELVAAGEARTDVIVRTDLNITGKPAQFGRGVMQDVSDKLLGQFATCLESRLAEQTEVGPAAAPLLAEESGEPVTPTLQEPADQEPADQEPADRAPVDETTDPSPGGPKHRASPEEAAADDSTAAPAGTPTSRLVTSTPAAELSLGSTLLPVLARRYAVQLIVGAVVLWLLRRRVRR